MRSLFIVPACALGLLASCGGESPAPKTPKSVPSASSAAASSALPPAAPFRAPPGALGALVKDIDPGDLPPLWPQAPEVLRESIDRGHQALVGEEARLGEARRLLDSWAPRIDYLDLPAFRRQLVTGLQILALAEPIARSGSAKAAEAHSVLHDLFFRAKDIPQLMEEMGKHFAGLGQAAADKAKSEIDMPLVQVLVPQADAHWRYYAVRILAAGQPENTAERLIGMSAAGYARSDRCPQVLPLVDEFQKRRGPTPRMEPADWLGVTELRTRCGDLQGAEAAFARVALPQDAPPALQARRTRNKGDLARLKKLIEVSKQTDIVARIEHVDMLFALARFREAEEQLAALVADKGSDPRVRARVAAAALELAANTSREQLIKELDARIAFMQSAESSDPAVLSLRVAMVAQRLFLNMPSFSTQAESAKAFFAKEFQTLKPLVAAYAKADPDRGLPLQYLVQTVDAAMSKASAKNQKPLFDALQNGAPAVQKIIAAHPNSADAYRLLYTHAMAQTDTKAGMRLVTAPIAVSPDDEPELFLQRARVATAIATNLRDNGALDDAAKLAAQLPARESDADSVAASVLRADIVVLRARVLGKPMPFELVKPAYQEALNNPSPVRARVCNNVAVLLAELGAYDEALPLFNASAAMAGEEAWLPLMNAALYGPGSAEGKAKALRAIMDKRTESTWIDVFYLNLIDDPAEIKRVAQLVAKEQDQPKNVLANMGTAEMGINFIRSLQLSVQIRSRSRFHVLYSSLVGDPWFMPKAPSYTTQEFHRMVKTGKKK
jgi:tetratricopeptide (TPR) repeat protein